MPADDRELIVHRQWLGLLQPVGLVASPPALVECGAVPEKNAVQLQERLHEVVERTTKRGEAAQAHAPDLLRLLEHVLDWRRTDVLGPDCAEPLPDTLDVPLPDYGETLRATYAARDPVTPGKTLLLIHVLPRGVKLDDPPPEESKTGWHASPYAKFERLLRKAAVPTGLLFNGAEVRLVHAPEHQTSGHLTFPVQAMTEVTGRPILAAFKMLLGAPTVFDLPDGKRLADILEKSRRYQNQVSNDLAEQVLGALWELLQGFQKADTKAEGKLLVAESADDREHIYGGLLTALMRLVFLLYAEDQGLLPSDRVWVDNYSVAGLWTRLRDDAALHPDTMDDRYGAWATLLALFRIVHHGGGHGAVKLPARRGQLFDPDAHPFLEGRSRGSAHDRAARIEAPRISDGCIHRVLSGLLVLDGERLSYRALDVEQIGSVYEAMMGYLVERMPGRSLAVSFKVSGIEKFVFFDLDELLTVPANDRVIWLQEKTTCDFEGKSKAISDAVTPDSVLAALGQRVWKRTPRVLAFGTLVLQPGEERRRSGSHYTPRDLTKPIVETTLRPVLEALGPKPTPERILGLKVCDPAMGSGAFLVETCRQLAERLVEAWDHQGQMPAIPADEDALLHAKRLIAQRCLYGVDKNPFAVNLAKLSLWLVTLARDHAFTFVDHALKHGDSLVGLTCEQIARFHWDIGSGRPMPLLAGLTTQTDAARAWRTELEELGDDQEDAKRSKLADADRQLADGRLAGDLVVAAYFSATKASDREIELAQHRAALDRMNNGKGGRDELEASVAKLRRGIHPLPPFHWNIEFPEVFARDNPGFDAAIGNPPYAHKNAIVSIGGPSYIPFFQSQYDGFHGYSDLGAYFVRRADAIVRRRGCWTFLCTKTVTEGKARDSGLDHVVRDGSTIIAARTGIQWPGAAAVVVCSISALRGEWIGERMLNGRGVSTISTGLAAETPWAPERLLANGNISSTGFLTYGRGFLLDRDAASQMIEADRRNSMVVVPLLSGADFTETPDIRPSQYVINFGSRTEVEAAQFTLPFAWVRKYAKEERMAASRDDARKYWWRLVGRAERVYQEAARLGLSETLANLRVSKRHVFARIPRDVAPESDMNVYALASNQAFAVLQSSAHQLWANRQASSLGTTRRYTPTTCFVTFPFPKGWSGCTALEQVGREYYEFRARWMRSEGLGFTEVYNRFHDPDDRDAGVARLRSLHAALDQAVIDAYGWSDIRLEWEFLSSFAGEGRIRPIGGQEDALAVRYRWKVSFHEGVLARLLALNHACAEEERLKGVPADAAALSPSKARRLAKAKRVAEMPADGLFGGGADDGEEQ